MKKSQADYQRTYRKKHPLSNQCSLTNRKAKRLGLSGRILLKQLDDLFQKYDYKCFYCSVQLTRAIQWKPSDTDLTIDHITPYSKGGKNIISNIVPCCRRCNVLKSKEISLWCEGCNTGNRMENLMKKVRKKRRTQYQENHKEEIAEKARLKRANMTPEQRKIAYERGKIKRANRTPEEIIAEKEYTKKYGANPENKLKRNALDRERRNNWTPEKREKELAKQRAKAKRRYDRQKALQERE